MGEAMEYRFNAEEWKGLTPAERVQRCRLWAHEASDLAVSADRTLKRHYLDIAHQWENLAREIEREAGLST
jgi:hypothetical protein